MRFFVVFAVLALTASVSAAPETTPAKIVHFAPFAISPTVGETKYHTSACIGGSGNGIFTDAACSQLATPASGSSCSFTQQCGDYITLNCLANSAAGGTSCGLPSGASLRFLNTGSLTQPALNLAYWASSSACAASANYVSTSTPSGSCVAISGLSGYYVKVNYNSASSTAISYLLLAVSVFASYLSARQ